MTSNMKSKTFWREYDDMNDAVGVKQVVVGAKGDYVILGWRKLANIFLSEQRGGKYFPYFSPDC